VVGIVAHQQNSLFFSGGALPSSTFHEVLSGDTGGRGRKIRKSRSHFDSVMGKKGQFWRCSYRTTYRYKSKRFVSEKALAHLAGNDNLAKGVVSVLCTECPGDVQAAMKKLILKVVGENARQSRRW
jgi:hypothetical protein